MKPALTAPFYVAATLFPNGRALLLRFSTAEAATADFNGRAESPRPWAHLELGTIDTDGKMHPHVTR